MRHSAKFLDDVKVLVARLHLLLVLTLLGLLQAYALMLDVLAV